MIILIDMDGVVADFESGVIKELKKNYPQIKIIEPRNKMIVNFYKEKNNEAYEIIEKIRNSKGFILNLKPINGSLVALKYLFEKNYNVFICTTPFSKNKYSMSEKYEWIIKNLGNEWKDRIIITEDKTLIRGDILIDDKPDINGLASPNWEHIIFDQPYNKQIIGKKRINWNNFKDVLKL